MSRVRIAVIGTGAWARHCHLPALRSRRDVELVALSDMDPRRVAEAAAEFEVPRATSDWRKVFDEDLDACVISSPAAAHYEQARTALDRGIHVLIEKPMVLRSSDAGDLVRRARSADREVVVSFGWNYSDLYRQACGLMADPGVGRIEHMVVHMASGTRDLLMGNSLSSSGGDGPDAVSRTWTDPNTSGGGYGQAQLPHALGVALGLTGESVTSFDAVASGPSGAVETCLAASGRLRGGGSVALSGASFHAGLSGNRHQLEIRVFGSNGNLLVDFERDELRVVRPDRTVSIDVPSGAGKYDGRGPVGALVDAARGRRGANLSPGDLGARTVVALEHIYTSFADTR